MRRRASDDDVIASDLSIVAFEWLLTCSKDRSKIKDYSDISFRSLRLLLVHEARSGVILTRCRSGRTPAEKVRCMIVSHMNPAKDSMDHVIHQYMCQGTDQYRHFQHFRVVVKVSRHHL